MYPLGVDLHLTGIPRIAADLNAAESALHIAFSVYLAGMASTMLIAGWCADHIGRRPVALTGAVIFALASVAAGSATTTPFFLSYCPLCARCGRGILLCSDICAAA